MHVNMHCPVARQSLRGTRREGAMIERLWAALHQYVTHNRYYSSQKHFADAILAFMRETIPREWKNFRDKVSDNFRVITHENFRVLE